jgi:hypothetical protein
LREAEARWKQGLGGQSADVLAEVRKIERKLADTCPFTWQCAPYTPSCAARESGLLGLIKLSGGWISSMACRFDVAVNRRQTRIW